MPASDSSSNPFATRYTRPGMLRFRFPPGTDVESLVRRLRDAHWLGQIVGPHGSGKSTLLAALEPALSAAGRDVRRFTLNQGQRRLPELFTLGGTSQQTLVIIDGYEQLGWFERLRVRARVRRRGWGLVTTTHRAGSLPTLWITQVDLPLALALGRELIAREHSAIRDQDIHAAFEAHGENLREAFFALYDVYEARRVIPASHAEDSGRAGK